MRQSLLFAVLFCLAMLLACAESSQEESCDDYCQANSDCARLDKELFSMSECQRECAENEERYGFVGCGYQYEELLRCLSTLTCTSLDKRMDDCSRQMNELGTCIR